MAQASRRRMACRRHEDAGRLASNAQRRSVEVTGENPDRNARIHEFSARFVVQGVIAFDGPGCPLRPDTTGGRSSVARWIAEQQLLDLLDSVRSRIKDKRVLTCLRSGSPADPPCAHSRGKLRRRLSSAAWTQVTSAAAPWIATGCPRRADSTTASRTSSTRRPSAAVMAGGRLS